MFIRSFIIFLICVFHHLIFVFIFQLQDQGKCRRNFMLGWILFMMIYLRILWFFDLHRGQNQVFFDDMMKVKSFRFFVLVKELMKVNCQFWFFDKFMILIGVVYKLEYLQLKFWIMNNFRFLFHLKFPNLLIMNLNRILNS